MIDMLIFLIFYFFRKRNFGRGYSRHFLETVHYNLDKALKMCMKSLITVWLKGITKFLRFFFFFLKPERAHT